jgi:hypothetical protein
VSGGFGDYGTAEEDWLTTPVQARGLNVPSLGKEGSECDLLNQGMTLEKILPWLKSFKYIRWVNYNVNYEESNFYADTGVCYSCFAWSAQASGDF